MNELPKLEDQAQELLLKAPSPFDQYDEDEKAFKAVGEKVWRSHCMEKFAWVREALNSNFEELTPALLAMRSDDSNM